MNTIRCAAFAAGLTIAAPVFAQSLTPAVGYLNHDAQVGQQCVIVSMYGQDTKFASPNLNVVMSQALLDAALDHTKIRLYTQKGTLTNCDGDSQVVPVVYIDYPK